MYIKLERVTGVGHLCVVSYILIVSSVSSSLSACVCVCLRVCVRLMTSFALTSLKVMCQCSLVASPWRYVSCQHDGQRADKKNSEAEEGMNREDGKEKEKEGGSDEFI